jgi:nucleotide-binding universal stress UspA family protein
VPITERGRRARRRGVVATLRRWIQSRKFEPPPCPPPSTSIAPVPIVIVAIASTQTDEPLFEALREAVRRICALDERCRIACMTVVPSVRSLSDDTETGRHIKHLVNLRRWAKALALPEERLTYHVLESEKPESALIDYATMNDVDQIVIGAQARWVAQVVAEAPCSVTVVRGKHER